MSTLLVSSGCWTYPETMLLLLWISEGKRQKECVLLLQQCGYIRTQDAVRNRVAQLKQQTNFFQEGRWRRDLIEQAIAGAPEM